MRTRTAPLALAATLLALAASGCGAEGLDDGGSAASFTDSSGWSQPDASAQPGPGPTADAGTGSDAAVGPDASAPDTWTPPPPPEEEVDFDLRTPEAGGSFLVTRHMV